jgi:hypothetical protein
MRHGCGAEYAPGALMCVCGELIVDDGGLTAPLPPPRAAEVPRSADAATTGCPRCTRQVPAGLEACPFCDARLARSAAATGVPTVVLPGGLGVPVVGELVLGRESGDVRIARALDYDGVSRRHASVGVRGAHVVIRDLGSTNGTRVNGAPIDGEVVLPPGDTPIGLGMNVIVTVQVPSSGGT